MFTNLKFGFKFSLQEDIFNGTSVLEFENHKQLGEGG